MDKAELVKVILHIGESFLPIGSVAQEPLDQIVDAVFAHGTPATDPVTGQPITREQVTAHIADVRAKAQAGIDVARGELPPDAVPEADPGA